MTTRLHPTVFLLLGPLLLGLMAGLASCQESNDEKQKPASDQSPTTRPEDPGTSPQPPATPAPQEGEKGTAGKDAKSGEEEEKTDAKPTPTAHPRVRMKTSLGTIVLELDREKAPVTVENFLRYAREGFYDGTIFHRVIANFMIQGGGFTPEMVKKTEGTHPPIKNEWDNGLKNLRGTIAMARTNAPNSATNEFFINTVDNLRLSQPMSGGAGYAVFGKVVEGMDVVDAIRNTPVTVHPRYPSGGQRVVPKEPVVIESVRLIEGSTEQEEEKGS